jgi:hypothetical protein
MKKKKKVIYDEESIEFIESTESTESIGSSLADLKLDIIDSFDVLNLKVI